MFKIKPFSFDELPLIYSRMLALLFILMLVRNHAVFEPQMASHQLDVIAIFSLNIAATYGIFRGLSWGYWVGYAAVIYSHLFFHVNYMPFSEFLEKDNHTEVLTFLSNLTILLAIFILQRIMWRKAKAKNNPPEE